ncbi:MAG: radical SAM protein [Negativicutes bacterium]|nr:radical SAM protein [Negativicutes bacterium]
MEQQRCTLCPRQCGVMRQEHGESKGYCGLPWLPGVCRAALHFGEEPNLSGQSGSGAVFFSGCVLRCSYCQNYRISRRSCGKAVNAAQLAAIFQELQAAGAHNINLVSPTPYVPLIVQALRLQPLRIPVVYNSSGYERVETLRQLEGLVDIYLPDYKYHQADLALQYSGAADYPQKAQAAILEMYRQVGLPQHDPDGMMQSGLMIRHLILPGHTKNSIAALQWLAEALPKGVYISLMAQYCPPAGLTLPAELQRRITRREYTKVANALLELGLENGFFQKRSAASEEYLPDWNWL